VGSGSQAKKGFIFLIVYILQSGNRVGDNCRICASYVGLYAQLVQYYYGICVVEYCDWNHCCYFWNALKQQHQ
jgi:hypothetical protein